MTTSAVPSAHVSVIICTRNRGDRIGATLTSVLTNDHVSFDLTVVDQSNNSETEDAVAPLASVDARLRYLHVTEPGLSRAYNTGIRNTSGELLAFTDDDCVVPSDWLTSIVRALEEDSEAGLLYGQVLAPKDGFRHGRITPVLRIPETRRLSKGDGFKVFGMGANFAARRQLFAQIGGFDELLGGGAPLASSQDYDLAFRAYRSGIAILLSSDVAVIHYGTRTAEQWLATERAYGIGDGAFYFKHMRCRDTFAMWLFGRAVLDAAWRYGAKRAFRRGSPSLNYLRAIPEGIRRGTQFGVDRRLRLYVQR
jgi:GT2 family glycosyltransferase